MQVSGDFTCLPACLPAPPVGQPAIKVSGDFTWNAAHAPALVDLDLVIPAGQLVLVVGSTGSGKSTLLSAMLGSMQQVGQPGSLSFTYPPSGTRSTVWIQINCLDPDQLWIQAACSR